MLDAIVALRRGGGTRRGASTTRGADDLRLHHDAGDTAVLGGLDTHRGVQLHDLAAFRLGTGDLGVLRGHVADATAVGDDDLLGAQAHTRARDVHGDVAAADDHDALAGEVRHLAVADGAQHLHRRHDTLGVLALQAQLLIAVGADGQIHRVVGGAHAVEVHAVDGALGLDLDAAVQDPLDLGLEVLARQAVARNAVAQHAA